MDKATIAEAIAQASDVCAAASGDVHTCHLNFHGAEFDTMHKKVLKNYYEQLDEDYDALAEKAGAYGYAAHNKNDAAKRVNWNSFEGDCDRKQAVVISGEAIGKVLVCMQSLYVSLNKIDDDVNAIATANYLQGRIEYWANEANYFNMRRI